MYHQLCSSAGWFATHGILGKLKARSLRSRVD